MQRFGAFVKLDETGADGLIPVRSIGSEYFHFDHDTQKLMGSETGLTLGLGQKVTVKLTEAVPVTGGLMLELLAVEGDSIARAPRRGRGKPVRRKVARSKAKSNKTRRKVTRTRR